MTVIAHVSDLHLGADPEPDARLRVVLDHLAAMAVPPAALLVTGDVLDRPDEAGDYAAVGEALAALGVPVLACPGNHDDRAGFRRLLGLDGGPAPVNGRLDLDGVTLLACDSSVPGAAWGQLEAATLAWLEQELAVGTAPVLLALHHTPVPIGVAIIDEIALREPDGLERVVRAAGDRVVATLCGHAHTASAAVFAGRPLVVCPPVASWVMLAEECGPDTVFDRAAPPAFAIHLVDGGRLTTHVRSVGWRPPGTMR